VKLEVEISVPSRRSICEPFQNELYKHGSMSDERRTMFFLVGRYLHKETRSGGFPRLNVAILDRVHNGVQGGAGAHGLGAQRFIGKVIATDIDWLSLGGDQFFIDFVFIVGQLLCDGRETCL
jgi:hypothetical protein